MGLAQQAFALLLGVSARTLQDWEQGRRRPTAGAAKTLLRVAVAHPECLARVAHKQAVKPARKSIVRLISVRRARTEEVALYES